MSALTHVYETRSTASLRAAVLAAMPSLSWRHHGIGVLQAYLVENAEPEVRVHVWHPSLVKPGMDKSGDVHDHRFDMMSHVLAGTVAHEEWFATPDPANGSFTTMILTHARAAAGANYHGPTTPTGERFEARINEMFVNPGWSYEFPAQCFHRSPVIGLAVTIVEKHRQRDEPARLLHPVDTPPVMAFGHEMDRAIVADVLRLAREALR